MYEKKIYVHINLTKHVQKLISEVKVAHDSKYFYMIECMYLHSKEPNKRVG